MSDLKIEKKDTPTNEEYLNLYELGVIDDLPLEALSAAGDEKPELQSS